MLFQSRFGYCVDESGAYNSYGRLHTYGNVLRLRVSVERALRNVYLRIDELIFLTVGKLHRQSAFHGSDLMPSHVNLVLVHRRQERRHSLRLRHSCHLAYERSVVAVVAVRRIVYYEQISVAVVRRLVCVLPFTVTVCRVTVDARCADRRRTESVERRSVQCDVAFEEHFSEVEVVYKSLIVHGRSLVFVASCLYVLSRAEPSSWIPLVFREIAYGFSDVFVVVVLPYAAEVFRVIGA